MQKILAIDAGGTSSRAVLLDPSGACSGFGRAGGGNPTAIGAVTAVEALGRAAESALGAKISPGADDSLVVIALAGTATPAFLALLEQRLTALGLCGRTIIEPDLLGTFCSGTALGDGYAVIAGTGAIAARVIDGQLHTVKGGSGWLLGDTGSGFWIGQQVVRAAVASLDGLGPPTALTGLLFEATGIARTGAHSRGRPEELSRLSHELYALQPVELARFAPLAFDAGDDESTGDAVARSILDAAAGGIAAVLSAVFEPCRDGAVLPGPEPGAESGAAPGVVVVGGSVLAAGLARAPALFAHRLAAAAPSAELIPVEDGVVGAAVLALRHLGRLAGAVTPVVDRAVHRRLTEEIRRARALSSDGPTGR